MLVQFELALTLLFGSRDAQVLGRGCPHEAVLVRQWSIEIGSPTGRPYQRLIEVDGGVIGADVAHGVHAVPSSLASLAFRGRGVPLHDPAQAHVTQASGRLYPGACTRSWQPASLRFEVHPRGRGCRVRRGRRPCSKSARCVRCWRRRDLQTNPAQGPRWPRSSCHDRRLPAARVLTHRSDEL